MPVNNPWTPEFWNITAQGDYIKKFGLSVATRTASKVGVRIGDLKPRSDALPTIERRWILSKKIMGGGSSGGQGSSGDGPPS